MKNRNLNTGNKFVSDIFNQKSFYSIPMYQRPYVWGEEQITTLLDDISTAMYNDSNKEYFLGCMIWNTKSDHDEDTGVEFIYQDILDGQQRFITLYLLHGVIRDLSSDADHKQDINKDLHQKANKRKGIPERNRVVFEIREDADFLRKYLIENDGTLAEKELKQISKDKYKALSVRNMAKAMNIMHEWWNEKKEEHGMGEEFQDYLDEFHTYLSTKVMLLYLATPDNLDDAYNLFTVLNSRGLQLRVGDILRAQNLRVIENKEIKKIYAQKWARFEDTITEPFRHFDDFLWTFVHLMMKYRSDDNKSITAAFDFMQNKKKFFSKGVEAIDKIESYVNHYEALTNGSLDLPQNGLFFSNLNFILMNTFGNQHFAIMMQYRERFGDHKILDLLIKIDNLITSSWLQGRRLPQTRIFIILRKIDAIYNEIGTKYHTREEAAEVFIEDDVLKYEYEDENSKAKPIDVEHLLETIDSEDFGNYGGTKTWKTRYLLLKLDLLFNDTNTPLQFNRNNCSIEHIMPRTPMKEHNWFVNKEDHDKWVHRLGNLILLNKKKNFSLSNQSYAVKKEKYRKQGIESRPFTNEIFYNDYWNIDTIKANHKRILNILRTYYKTNSIDILRKLNNLKSENYQNSLFE